MIKFFRKIRYNLLKENNMGKYFKYAIGEILLVVIGILIALQINNWNTDKNKNIEATLFLNRILTEIDANKLEIDKQIDIEHNQKESAWQILHLIGKDYHERSSRKLDSLVYIILFGNYLDLATSTMEEGFNSGQVALVNSEQIRNALYKIKAEISDVEQSILKGNIDMRNNLFPYLYDYFNWRKMDYTYSANGEEIGASYFNSNNKALLTSMKFESLMDNRFWACNQQLDKLNNLKEKLLNLENLILNFLETEGDD